MQLSLSQSLPDLLESLPPPPQFYTAGPSWPYPAHNVAECQLSRAGPLGVRKVELLVLHSHGRASLLWLTARVGGGGKVALLWWTGAHVRGGEIAPTLEPQNSVFDSS